MLALIVVGRDMCDRVLCMLSDMEESILAVMLTMRVLRMSKPSTRKNTTTHAVAMTAVHRLYIL